MAFHAAVLTFPVSFLEPVGEQVIPVIILSGGSGNEPGLGGRGKEKGNQEGPDRDTRRQLHASTLVSRSENLDESGDPKEAIKSEGKLPVLSQEVSGKEVLIAGLGKPRAQETQDLSPGGAGGGGAAEGTGGRGDSAIGPGSGGSGGEGSGSGLVFAQANYSYSPKPNYPERARAEGWEGTVLIRVLVDPQGKSKWVEVSRSSGFAVLDGAAVEAVKRWRFQPARYGDRRVESWVKVPIIFQLKDRDRDS